MYPKEPINTENKTPITADRLDEFNLEAYKEEVEASISMAKTTIDKFDE